MLTLANDILTRHIPKGSFGLFSVGQAGYIIKTPDSQLIAIDLYLSDSCNRLVGFKRLMPYILDATDIAFDTIICTHEHEDHLDIDSVPFMFSYGSPELFVNAESVEKLKAFGVVGDRVKLMERGGCYTSGSVKIEATFCDHGTAAPNAVGLILTIEGKTMYIAGDTSYRPEMIADIANRHIDVMAVPINGAYGNLNEIEGAKYSALVNPALTLPYHYGMFAQHGGDPGKFMTAMQELAPNNDYMLMRPGEGIII